METNVIEDLKKMSSGMLGIKNFVKLQAANNPNFTQEQRDEINKKIDEADFSKSENDLKDAMEKLNNLTNANYQSK